MLPRSYIYTDVLAAMALLDCMHEFCSPEGGLASAAITPQEARDLSDELGSRELHTRLLAIAPAVSGVWLETPNELKEGIAFDYDFAMQALPEFIRADGKPDIGQIYSTLRLWINDPNRRVPTGW